MTQCSVTLQKMEERYRTPFRYTHEFMGFTRWQDFEEKIYIKRNAAWILQRKLTPARLKDQQIGLGTATDPYQPAERGYRVTRMVR